MATGKRYYWIKLKDTFMTSDAVDFLMGQKDGANYVVLYQMLCLKTINTGGRLERTIGEVIIPYDEEKIQRDTKWFTIDTVRVALNLYKSLGLIYADDNGVLCLTDHDNMVGSATDYADQKKLQREKQQNLLPDGGVDNVHSDVHENVHTDIRDKDIKRLDIRDKENNTPPKSPSRGKREFVPPTLEDVEAYCKERNSPVDPKSFYDYFTAGNWYDSKGQKVRSWKQKLITWEKGGNNNAGINQSGLSERDRKSQEVARKYAGRNFYSE